MTGAIAPRRPAAACAPAAKPGALSPVDLFGVRFPRLDHEGALQWLVGRVHAGETTALCFPDMSTLNLAATNPSFRRLLRDRFTTWNDGAGLELAARLRGRPFPANLNGTDLVPALFERVAAGTTLFLLGARPGVAERAAAALATRYPQLRLVGHHDGYFDATGERAIVKQLGQLRPRIVMVGMGHPLQVELIDRHRDDPALAGTTWMAVGGQLDYYGADLRRAPRWMIRARLEWLHLVISQPHKAKRYFVGIPMFFCRFLWTQVRGRHDVAAAP